MEETPTEETPKINTHTNERFKNVKVVMVSQDSFLISGQAQTFEANIGWVVEDGHYQIAKGFATADKGAPAWGDFSFGVKAEKLEANTTLLLILYETSAKDGSHQHELIIPLRQ